MATLRQLYTIAMVQWNVRRKGTLSLEPVAAQCLIEQHRVDAQDRSKPLPPGWHRQIAKVKEAKYGKSRGGADRLPEHTSAKQYFIHDSYPGFEFWHPIPLYNNIREASPSHIDPLLLCHTQRAWLSLAERLQSHGLYRDRITVSL
jgi:hypothetical protein